MVIISGCARIWSIKNNYNPFGRVLLGWVFVYIGSMYSIFTYIWLIFIVNVGKYTIHWSYGYWDNSFCWSFPGAVMLQWTLSTNVIFRLHAAVGSRLQGKIHRRTGGTRGTRGARNTAPSRAKAGGGQPCSHGCTPGSWKHVIQPNQTSKWFQSIMSFWFHQWV